MRMYTIMVVDDEQAILDLAVDTLKKDDYFVITAESGEEGLETLKLHNVNLIISDQRMDGISGIDFLKKVKEAYPNIITIMLTGFAETETAVQAVNDAGVYKFIVKPWNIIDFRNTVERALELHHLITEKGVLKKRLEAQKSAFSVLQKKLPHIF